MIIIHEALGNFSHVLETFDSLDSASEYLEDRVRDDIRDNETQEDIDNPQELESLRGLYFSYYSIEEAS